MTASQQLSTLSDRAKTAEDNVNAAMTKTDAELQDQADAARQSSQEKAAALKNKADAAQSEGSDKWNNMKTQWAGHVADVHRKADEKKADLDANQVEYRAEDAEAYAQYAVDFACAAIDEAESAVLDAQVARVEADNYVATPG